ncbi:ankyrin repeat-containing domain protein [Coprinopsis sp. MPI-PUGE-AT-0042]|nr:ankyrin repeat-containing domain protein [Coprinopsis sp. MPI-PUGE-AT-0042]
MFAASAHSQRGICLTTKKALKRLGGLADPPRDWFCRETFRAMRVLHNSDADAVLACLNNVTSVLRQAPLHSTENPLTIAIQRGDAEAVRKLLLLGVDVHTKDKSLCRLNPLHKAIDKGHEPIVRLLLQANASVKTRMQAMPLLHGVGDQFNYSNATALHLAVWKGDPSIVQALLEHGANIHARTGSDKAEAPCNEGQRVTPLEIALCLDLSGPRRLHPDRLVIASMLLERGAIFTAFIARQWKRLKLNEVLEMFSGHEILWDTFVAGGWDAVDYEMQQGNQ